MRGGGMGRAPHKAGVPTEVDERPHQDDPAPVFLLLLLFGLLFKHLLLPRRRGMEARVFCSQEQVSKAVEVAYPYQAGQAHAVQVHRAALRQGVVEPCKDNLGQGCLPFVDVRSHVEDVDCDAGGGGQVARRE
jgi:hypothetical protein